jgi:hypothetical protein
MSRQRFVRDLSDARTCSSRSDLVAALPFAQEISAAQAHLVAARRNGISLTSFFLGYIASLKSDPMIVLGNL